MSESTVITERLLKWTRASQGLRPAEVMCFFSFVASRTVVYSLTHFMSYSVVFLICALLKNSNYWVLPNFFAIIWFQGHNSTQEVMAWSLAAWEGIEPMPLIDLGDLRIIQICCSKASIGVLTSSGKVFALQQDNCVSSDLFISQF